MYKTKIGLKLMDKWGEKYRESIKLLALIGIGVGYIGLFTIIYFLSKNLIQLLTVPKATSAVSLVIPGVKVPGSPVMIPLITGWIALFLVILVHEFSHGVVARAHKLKVLSSGIFFLGPLMGAFVEPDEKKVEKASDVTQYSVYAAGPFSNILLALLCLLLVTYAFNPLNGLMVNELGVKLAGTTEGYPAADAGLTAGMVVTNINGIDVMNYGQFANIVSHIKPNESVTIVADGKEYSFLAGTHPNNKYQGYLGVMANNRPETEPKNDAWWFKIIYRVFLWFAELLSITFILSFGIGLANLLPLGPVDGGRMLLTSLTKIKGKEKGYYWWKTISLFTLLLLGVSLLWPLLKWIVNMSIAIIGLVL